MSGLRRLHTGSLACLLALGSAVPAVRAADDRPREIRSWRHEILSAQEYDSLATAWGEYVKAHPQDVRAIVEWGDAVRYANQTGGSPKDKAEDPRKIYERAFAMDPKAAPAIEAHVRTNLITDHDRADWPAARRLLLEAVAADPAFADTYYMLWMVNLHEGDRAGADEALRTLIRLGDIGRPVADFAYNMLASAPQNAIVLTNGDNDTYPPLALQATTGMRKDVAIVNLSLLNTRWYVRYCRDAGVPIPLDDAAIDALQWSEAATISAQVQRILYDTVRSRGDRPLLYSITVPDWNKKIPAARRISGMLETVGPGPGEESAEADLDVDTTRRLIDTVLRFDSMTDPLYPWDWEGSIARLGHNYVSLFTRVGQSLSASGKARDAGPYYARAIALLVFHKARERAAEILALWEKEDPQSPLLADTKKRSGL